MVIRVVGRRVVVVLLVVADEGILAWLERM